MGLISGKARWIDPLLHAIAAIAIVGIGALMGAAWQVAVIQAIFWFAREVEQDVARKLNAGKPVWPVWPARYSSQKWIEFVVPATAGFMCAAVVS